LRNKKRILYAVYAVVISLVIVFAYTFPLLLSAHKQRNALEATFSQYSHALLATDYAAAYSYGDAAFKAELTQQEFAGQQASFVSKLGKPKAIDIEGFDVRGHGSPIRRIAIIREDRRYENGAVHILSEFHFEYGRWQLFGYKQVD
jgi:hypothetical protein